MHLHAEHIVSLPVSSILSTHTAQSQPPQAQDAVPDDLTTSMLPATGIAPSASDSQASSAPAESNTRAYIPSREHLASHFDFHNRATDDPSILTSPTDEYSTITSLVEGVGTLSPAAPQETSQIDGTSPVASTPCIVSDKIVTLNSLSERAHDPGTLATANVTLMVNSHNLEASSSPMVHEDHASSLVISPISSQCHPQHTNALCFAPAVPKADESLAPLKLYDSGSLEPPEDVDSVIDLAYCPQVSVQQPSATCDSTEGSVTVYGASTPSGPSGNPATDILSASHNPFSDHGPCLDTRDINDLNIDGDPLDGFDHIASLRDDSALILTGCLPIPTAAVLLPVHIKDSPAASSLDTYQSYGAHETSGDLSVSPATFLTVATGQNTEAQLQFTGCPPCSGLPPSVTSERPDNADDAQLLLSTDLNPLVCADGVGIIAPNHNGSPRVVPIVERFDTEDYVVDNKVPDEVASLPDDDDTYDFTPSSPPPSSSPFPVFSPPHQHSFDSPPSSSPPFPPCNAADHPNEPSVEDVQKVVEPEPTSLKRSLEVVTLTGFPRDDAVLELVERTSKRLKIEQSSLNHQPPSPKRSISIAESQAKQRKKLAAPFRSPVIKGPLVQGGLHAVYSTGRTPVLPPPRKTQLEDARNGTDVLSKPRAGISNKDRTANAAKQFKSPLQIAYPPGSASAGPPFTTITTGPSGARTAPTVQALQGKVQTLKQAIKIKTTGGGDEDEILERLVQKWTAAGREVAWAVWDHVKDLDPGPEGDRAVQKSGWFVDDEVCVHAGQKRGLDPSWGYGDDDEQEQVQKKAKLELQGGAGEEEDVEEEGSHVVQHTLGVMLRRLGIDPATLGWDEEEGDFVDV